MIRSIATRDRTKKRAAAEISVAFVGFGVAGWLLENTLYPGRDASRRSRFWSVMGVPEGWTIPFLPTYAFGGAALAAVAPLVKSRPRFDRFAAYFAITTAVELLACQVDRGTGGAAWDYSATSDGTGPCIDMPHSLAWAALAMAAERFV